MPRRKVAARREILSDARYNNKLVAKFINSMMYDGQKMVATQSFYDALDVLGEKHGEGALNVFKTAVENVKPALEVKSRRVGGATYQVPVEIRPERRTSLAIRWILTAARARKEKTIAQKLAAELADAFKNQGTAIKKKEDTHKMAEANQAFAHYRW
ncbi:MAG TPA: 30S ribosomal protein S7 [bacterium]|nr:30S ribosomal protein S7 [bacterium]